MKKIKSMFLVLIMVIMLFVSVSYIGFVSYEVAVPIDPVPIPYSIRK